MTVLNNSSSISRGEPKRHRGTEHEAKELASGNLLMKMVSGVRLWEIGLQKKGSRDEAAK